MCGNVEEIFFWPKKLQMIFLWFQSFKVAWCSYQSLFQQKSCFIYINVSWDLILLHLYESDATSHYSAFLLTAIKLHTPRNTTYFDKGSNINDEWNFGKIEQSFHTDTSFESGIHLTALFIQIMIPSIAVHFFFQKVKKYLCSTIFHYIQ